MDELRYCLTATGDHPLSEEEFTEVLSRADFDEVSQIIPDFDFSTQKLTSDFLQHGKLHFSQFAKLVYNEK